VWSLCVVGLPPGADHDPCLEHGLEDFAVEQLIAHGPVEPLDECILLRTALLYEGRRDSLLHEPADKCRGNELASVV